MQKGQGRFLSTLAEFFHSDHDVESDGVFCLDARCCWSPRRTPFDCPLRAGLEFIQMFAGGIQGKLKSL
jgi:hypothetical protein